MDDPYRLSRFVEAQKRDYDTAISELRAGRKRSRWMWYIFPQLRGLGRSANAERYGIGSLNEAHAYWAHPVLGARLRECIETILAVPGRSAYDIFGEPDDWKLRCCLTLFEVAAPDEPLFGRALERFFNGHRNRKTLELLNSSRPRRGGGG
jgi:uncharacterized protein (DUF1810 family)